MRVFRRFRATLVFQIRVSTVSYFDEGREGGRKEGPASGLCRPLGRRGEGEEEEEGRKYPSVIKWLVRFESGDGDQSINPGETSGGPCNSMDYSTSTLQQSSSSLSRESREGSFRPALPLWCCSRDSSNRKFRKLAEEEGETWDKGGYILGEYP